MPTIKLSKPVHFQTPKAEICVDSIRVSLEAGTAFYNPCPPFSPDRVFSISDELRALLLAEVRADAEKIGGDA